MIQDAQLVEWFKPALDIDAEKAERMDILQDATLEYARVIVRVVPPSPDQTVAFRKLRELLWTAGAAIMLEPTTTET